MSSKRIEIRQAVKQQINLAAALSGRVIDSDGRLVDASDLPLCKVSMFGYPEDVRTLSNAFGARRTVARSCQFEVKLLVIAAGDGQDSADMLAAEVERVLLATDKPLGGLVDDLRLMRSVAADSTETGQQIVELNMIFECAYQTRTS